jgi:hypothetical protein
MCGDVLPFVRVCNYAIYTLISPGCTADSIQSVFTDIQAGIIDFVWNPAAT